MKKTVLLLILLLSPALFCGQFCTQAGINRQTFLAKQDPVWEKLSQQFDHGAFLGNGLFGTTIIRDGAQQICFEIGRSDMTDHRRDNARLPLGGLLLKTVGQIQSGTLHADLWNAEMRREIVTDRRQIRFRTVNHAEEIVLLAGFDFEGQESEAAFRWEAKLSAVSRKERDDAHIVPNPAPESRHRRTTGSTAGEPCRVKPHFDGKFRLSSEHPVKSKEIKSGLLELNPKKAQEALLYRDSDLLDRIVIPGAIPHRGRRISGT
jgi:hypothetical protein